MSDEEYNGIVRDMEIESDVDDKYFVAQQIMTETKTVVYSGNVWWWHNGRYVRDENNMELIRKVYQRCEGKDTRFVDEIIKQIKYRSPYVKADTIFPIRFKNGFLMNGEFVPSKEFTEFTPFYIDISLRSSRRNSECLLRRRTTLSAWTSSSRLSAHSRSFTTETLSLSRQRNEVTND